MTDAEAKAAYRPLLENILAALKARTSTPTNGHVITREPDCFSDGVEEAGGNAITGFSAADLERFHDYYGPDERGHYPGNLHRTFNVGVKHFADALKMCRVGGVEDGKPAWKWKAREKAKEPEPDTFSDFTAEDGAQYFSDTVMQAMADEFGEDVQRFADRSGWVLKEVTTKHGHRVHRWTNPNKAQADAERKARSEAFKKAHEGRTPREHLEHTKAQAEPERAKDRETFDRFQKSGSITKADANHLGQHLGALTRDELRTLAKGIAQKLGGKKAELVQRLLDYVGSKAVVPQNEAHAAAVDELGTKLGDGRKIQFVPHPNQMPYETTILVDPKKFDSDYRKNPNRVSPEGDNAIGGRMEGVERFLKTGEPIQASRAVIHKGVPDIGDGRHRFATLLKNGAEEVALTVPKDQEAEFKDKYRLDPGRPTPAPEPDPLDMQSLLDVQPEGTPLGHRHKEPVDSVKRRADAVVPEIGEKPKTNIPTDPKATKKYAETGQAAAFRIQDGNYDLPEKSKNTWNDDEEFMRGVSGYANMENALGDMLFGRSESVRGDNYT